MTDIYEYINNCMECKKDKVPSLCIQYCMILPDFAFYIISIDIIGPLLTTTLRNRFIIVVIDFLTKWVEVQPIPSNSAKNITRFILQNIIFHYGCP